MKHVRLVTKRPVQAQSGISVADKIQFVIDLLQAFAPVLELKNEPGA